MTQEPGSWSPGQPAGPGQHQSAPDVAGGPAYPGSSQQSGPLPAPVPAPVPAAVPAPVAPTPAEGRWRPGRLQAVPGTEFGVMYLQMAPMTSGMAVGALLAGVAAVLVSFVVFCFGLVGSSEGWGAWVAGAFTLLGGLAGGAGIGLGMAALRQIRRSGQPGLIRFTGRGVAIGGIACGGAGVTVSLLSLGLALLLQFS